MVPAASVSRIAMHLLLLSLWGASHAAPTHHLSIGVQGNTPTLIVTSSEVGIGSGDEKPSFSAGKVRKDAKLKAKHKAFKSNYDSSLKKVKPSTLAKSTLAPQLLATDSPGVLPAAVSPQFTPPSRASLLVAKELEQAPRTTALVPQPPEFAPTPRGPDKEEQGSAVNEPTSTTANPGASSRASHDGIPETAKVLAPTETACAKAMAPTATEVPSNSEALRLTDPKPSADASPPSTAQTTAERDQTEAVLKLIDLEGHSLRALESISQQNPAEADNGHDGLKSIRKKQLADRHFLETLPSSTVPASADPAAVSDDGRTNVSLAAMPETAAFEQDRNATSVSANAADTTTDNCCGDNSTKEAAADPLQSQPEAHNRNAVLSSTVFEVADMVSTNTPSKAANTLFTSSGDGLSLARGSSAQETESKISDIQVEVYDSTVDSIVASTNFRDSEAASQGKSTKPPSSVTVQERFTQYVVDRTETSTQESINFSTIQVASGMPEPAAIEIHINVSESFGANPEEQDVSFPQAEFGITDRTEEAYDDGKAKNIVKLKDPVANKFLSDEILVVEIVDNVENATESKPEPQPITDSPSLASHYPAAGRTSAPPAVPRNNIDRDSDTIFYISNTEVKVGESPPTSSRVFDQRKINLENQFFPANYMASTHPNANRDDDVGGHHVYEEDILLSSDRNQADALKIYRNRNEPSPPLDVTYVGESIIEVEQSPDSSSTTTLANDHSVTLQPDVVIQPAILPEISIGVPVIGELPPQIEVKEVDFIPHAVPLRPADVLGKRTANSIAETAGNRDSDGRQDDSSVQYGGDLIDDSADGGFDGVEGSYPFGNPAAMAQRKHNHVADYAHLYVNYGVNNLRKEELSADLKDSEELGVIVSTAPGQGAVRNASLDDMLGRNTFGNSTNPTDGERAANVTAFSIMEDPSDLYEKSTEDIINLISLAIGLFIVILPVVVTCSMLWALRYLYKKYHSSSTDSNGNVDLGDAKEPPPESPGGKGEDISRVARETKMDYHKDGVFVVEVARGIDSKTIPESPGVDGGDKVISMFEARGLAAPIYKLTDEKVSHNNEKVQIHSPPPEKGEDGPRSLHQIAEVDELGHSPLLCDRVLDQSNCKSNTGLSQSDLSSTSSNDSNKDYCYGNQELYVLDRDAYAAMSISTHTHARESDSKVPRDRSDDRNSEDGHCLERSPRRQEGVGEAERYADARAQHAGTHVNGDVPLTSDPTEDETDPNPTDDDGDGDASRLDPNAVDSEATADVCNPAADEPASTVEQPLSPAEIPPSSAEKCADNTDTEVSLTEAASGAGPLLHKCGDTDAGMVNGEPMSCVNDNTTPPQSPVATGRCLLPTSDQSEADDPVGLPDKPNSVDGQEAALPEDGCPETNISPSKAVRTTLGSDDRSSPKVEDDLRTLSHESVLGWDGQEMPATEEENGYDSIMSLPAPPPSEEINCGEYSDTQLDSLPPPPPPIVCEANGVTATGKDLAMPVVNGDPPLASIADAAHFYASLPPPPPTTLEMTVTPAANGNIHASPLTPPASPPPHFSSRLHAHTMCAPIAVDVNGS